MKNTKSVILIEILLIIMIGFFSLDFLPHNFREFNGICSETWPTDAKQLQICMQPYYRSIQLDKYAVGVAVIFLIVTPLFYFFKRSKVS